MKAVFVELPGFARYRADYLDDDAYRRLQLELMKNPLAGDVMRGCDGLRKIRFADARRGKGKRGGTRVIYYWQIRADEFWLFTIYDKNDMSDLGEDQRRQFVEALHHEIQTRQNHETRPVQ
jgi:hypothetical protein